MDTPSDYKNAGTALLVGGVFNIMLAGVWFLSLFWICVGFLWLIPMGVGAWQSYKGYQAMNGAPADLKTLGIASLVAGVCNFSPISVIAGVYAMQVAGKPEVMGWLEQR